MRDGVACGDLNPVLYVAHARKGTLAMFGAKPASEFAFEIERCAANQDAAGAGVRWGLLEIEIGRLISVIPPDGPD